MVALVAVIQARTTPTAQRGTDVEFQALVDRYYLEWSKNDPDKAAPLYAKDADLVFFDLAPMKYTGWAEYREGVKKNFFDKMSSGKVTPGHDPKVVRRGNIAWTVVTNHFDITLRDGRKIETDGRHTAIWELRGGKWLIVHEHVSAPLPPL